MSKFNNQPRKSAPLGDLAVKERKDANGNFVADLYEVRDKNGNPTGEYTQRYSLKTYIPDDVSEIQDLLGSLVEAARAKSSNGSIKMSDLESVAQSFVEPSIVLKRDQFIDARGLTEFEISRLPAFLKNADGSSKVACKLSIQVGDRKQYPKKG